MREKYRFMLVRDTRNVRPFSDRVTEYLLVLHSTTCSSRLVSPTSCLATKWRYYPNITYDKKWVGRQQRRSPLFRVVYRMLAFHDNHTAVIIWNLKLFRNNENKVRKIDLLNQEDLRHAKKKKNKIVALLRLYIIVYNYWNEQNAGRSTSNIRTCTLFCQITTFLQA